MVDVQTVSVVIASPNSKLPLPVGGNEAEKELEKKRSKKRDEKGVRKIVR